MNFPKIINTDGRLQYSPAANVWVLFTHITDSDFCTDVFYNDKIVACVFNETGQELMAEYLEIIKFSEFDQELLDTYLEIIK